MTTDNKQLDSFKTWLNLADFDGLNCAVKSELTDYVAGVLIDMDKLAVDADKLNRMFEWRRTQGDQ